MKVARILADNPGPFTGPGTNTYVIADEAGVAAVIDPGPVLEEHREAVRARLEALSPVAVLVTHTHRDHAPAANPLGAAFGIPVFGFSDGPEFVPDHRLADGDEVDVGSITLRAVHTPGHTPDHLCFVAGDALFTGDHIMEGSTVVIEDAAAYMASLRKIRSLRPERLYPGHGSVVDDAAGVIEEYISHREQRERQILAVLAGGPSTVAEIVDVVYRGVPETLIPAATRQVVVQLRKLEAEGLVHSRSGAAESGARVELVEDAGP